MPEVNPIIQMLLGMQPQPASPSGDLSDLIGKFLMLDMQRRTGMDQNPAASAIQDRRNEGALMASLLGPFSPVATVPVAAAAAGYEGMKGLGQATGLGRFFPGPFQQDASTSPASIENILALLQGFTNKGAQTDRSKR